MIWILRKDILKITMNSGILSIDWEICTLIYFKMVLINKFSKLIELAFPFDDLFGDFDTKSINYVNVDDDDIFENKS